MKTFKEFIKESKDNPLGIKHPDVIVNLDKVKVGDIADLKATVVKALKKAKVPGRTILSYGKDIETDDGNEYQHALAVTLQYITAK